MGLFKKKAGSGTAAEGAAAVATAPPETPKPAKAVKAPEPQPLEWNQGQMNPRKFTVGAATEKEVREWLEAVCKQHGVDPAKANIVVRPGRYGEMWKYSGFNGSMELPKPEKKVETKPDKKAGKKDDKKKAEKAVPVKQDKAEIARLTGIAKKHGVTFEAPYSFYGPDQGKITAAIAEAFPSASTTFGTDKRGGVMGIRGKMVKIGTATPVAAAEAPTAQVLTVTEVTTEGTVDFDAAPVVGIGEKSPKGTKAAVAKPGPKPAAELTSAQKRELVSGRRGKAQSLSDWARRILGGKYDSFDELLKALLEGAEKAAKDRSADTAGSFRVLAWYAAASVLVNSRPKSDDDETLTRWNEAAQAFLTQSGFKGEFGAVILSSAYPAVLALAGVQDLLKRPQLFAKSGGIIGMADDNAAAKAKVDPKQEFDAAERAGSTLADALVIQLAPEASEGLPAMVSDLLEKFAAAHKSQGSRTTAAAAILAAANASRALKRFFSETKGADGGEGDDHTVAAAYLLLSHRVPALNLKGPEMAVAALRAVYAVHENA